MVPPFRKWCSRQRSNGNAVARRKVAGHKALHERRSIGPRPVLRRPGFHHVSGLGARAICACRDDRFRLPPAAPNRAGSTACGPGRDPPPLSRLGGAGWARTISSTWACSARSARRRSPATSPSRWRRTACPTPSCPGRNLLFFTFAAAVAWRRGIRSLVGGMCETDFSGYPDCRDNTIKALQVALNLGMDRSFVLQTPLMWLDKAETWALAQELGGEALVEMILEHTHTCYRERARAARRLGPRLRRLPRLRLAQAGLSRMARGQEGRLAAAGQALGVFQYVFGLGQHASARSGAAGRCSRSASRRRTASTASVCDGELGVGSRPRRSRPLAAH